MSKRDLRREREFLRAAASDHTFVDHAEQRLTAGQELFGDSWAWAGVPRLLAEMLEEAADLATWAVLTDQAIDLDKRLTEQQRKQLRAALHVAARRGAQAHQLLANARNAIEATSETPSIETEQSTTRTKGHTQCSA